MAVTKAAQFHKKESMYIHGLIRETMKNLSPEHLSGHISMLVGNPEKGI